MSHRSTFSSRSRAFTLIELLIVVAIIAILAAIAVPNFLEAQVRSKVARCKADMRSMATAVESYAVDNNTYPLYGQIKPDNSVYEPATTVGMYDKNEFPMYTITTPIAYITSRFEDPFATKIPGPEPYIRYINYINLPYHLYTLNNPMSEADKQDILNKSGQWRMIACGPDGDRGADAKLNIIYDPTNGTVSNGDIVRTQKYSESVPRQ
ncbi:MAG: prepilin-type N-terminal cleavage/methylation domain-containing protein [Candidatus Sumerlaeaceae bacterium]